MKLLNKLTLKNLKLNKKRSIVTVIGIMLSVALITAVSSMVVSFKESLLNYEKTYNGNYHYSFNNVKAEDLNKFRNNRNIEEVYITSSQGYAQLEDCKNEYKPYAYIMEINNAGFEKMGLNLVEGRFPENDKEIIIPKHLKTNGRITLNVGDTISLNVGTRVSAGEELLQENPYNKEEKEEIIDTVNRKYKIVGIIERPNFEQYSAPGYTFITCLNNETENKNYAVYARYTKDGLKNRYNVTANILGVDEKIFEEGFNQDFDEQKAQIFFEEMKKAKYEFNFNNEVIKLEAPTIEFRRNNGKHNNDSNYSYYHNNCNICILY